MLSKYTTEVYQTMIVLLEYIDRLLQFPWMYEYSY